VNESSKQFEIKPHELLMVPFADAAAPRVWLPPADTLPKGTAPATFNGIESQSRGRQNNPAEGPIADLRPDTFRSTRNNSKADEDWFAVQLQKPAKIARVVFRHGSTRPNGGWFDTSTGKPRIEYKATADGEWQPLGTLDDYPATTGKTAPTIPNGQPFELKLKEPVTVAAIRVIGKPSFGYKTAVSFSTCAELQAYEE
jgi:hypothetical protein